MARRVLKLLEFEKEVKMHVHALDNIEWQGRKWKIVLLSEDRDVIVLED